MTTSAPDVFAMQLAALSTVRFAQTSRYYGIETTTVVVDGRSYTCLKRRIVPAPEQLAFFGTHVVTQGERLDHIASRALGDPELFWRICDGNRAMQPEELTAEVGRRLLITMPAGVPGIPNA
jgi:hypothetical protein